MSLKSDLKSAFTSAYDASKEDTADYLVISDDMASAIATAIQTCIEGGNVKTSYLGATLLPPGSSTGATIDVDGELISISVTGDGQFNASAGVDAFEQGLAALLKDKGSIVPSIVGGQDFHTKFSNLLSVWAVSCIATDTQTGNIIPIPVPPPFSSFSGSGQSLTVSVLPADTLTLADAINISQSYEPADEGVGDDYVAQVWSDAITTYIESWVVKMSGSSSGNPGLLGQASLSNFT